MNFILSLIEKVYDPKKQVLALQCIKRFDRAYKDVSKLLPENTVDKLIKQIPER